MLENNQTPMIIARVFTDWGGGGSIDLLLGYEI